MNTLLMFLAIMTQQQVNAEVIASPPHIVRIATKPGYATFPDGTRIILPIGTTIPASHLTYTPESRITDVHATDEIFRNGFESTD